MSHCAASARVSAWDESEHDSSQRDAIRMKRDYHVSGLDLVHHVEYCPAYRLLGIRVAVKQYEHSTNWQRLEGKFVFRSDQWYSNLL